MKLYIVFRVKNRIKDPVNNLAKTLFKNQAALERLAREFAAIEKIDKDAAAMKLEDMMDVA